jgi:streptogramin lyase
MSKPMSANIVLRIFSTFFLALYLAGCSETAGVKQSDVQNGQDTVFWQEYHEPFSIGASPADNEVRSIAVDGQRNVWAATLSGIFIRRDNTSGWSGMLDEKDAGPSFCVVHDSLDEAVWMSTWKAVYRFRDGKLEMMAGPSPPISVLCPSREGVYAIGPGGIWLYHSARWEKLIYPLARSVRDAIADDHGGIWMASDAGLFHAAKNKSDHYYTPANTMSAYVRGVAFDNAGNLWAGGLGGVAILKDDTKIKTLSPEQGIPSIQVTTVRRGPDGVMWVGTDKGVVRFGKDFSHSLRFSRRWLLDDRVNDIAFDADGNAWIATERGVSAIKRKKMTLAAKADYFYDVLMRRHIRDPWIAGQCKLPHAGDTTVWQPDDDDNDGEYTSNYLAMESFRYATTRDPRARENAEKAFAFLKLLGDVTGKPGFFARTIVPSDYEDVDDANRIYSERERADEMVKEPRFKPVEVRWHRTKDGKWTWKGDTSSDEVGGHMMGYFFYYELAADEAGKQAVRREVTAIVDHLLANDYNFIDVDGKHTRWGVWSPALLNHDPEWTPDRSLNSMELLSFLKLAFYVSGDKKYEDAYRGLIDKQGYLRNMAGIPEQNPAWFVYFDVILAAYQYPILLKCEKDPELLSFYEKHIDAWFEKYQHDRNPLINFIYCYSRNKRAGLEASVEFLQDAPLDLVDWPIDHTQREDVHLVHRPVLDEVQVDVLPPASIRATVRWDKNPYAAVSGNPSVEREPVFWLLPYWMGRYLGMISEPVSQ